MVSRPIIPHPITTTRSDTGGRRRSTAWTATASGSTIAACSNGSVRGQLVEDPRRHGDELRERAVAPVVGARDAEHRPRVAQVDVAAAAEVTAAAIDRGVEGDAIAGREPGHGGAGPFDHPGRLVAHHERRDAAAGDAGVAVDVAAADAAGAHADEDVLVADVRQRHVGHRQPAVFGEQQRFHRRGKVLRF